MRFKINDLVLYGINGVCRIQDIKDLDIGTYYILIPVHEDRTKLMVPAKNEELTSRMRPVPSAKTMDGVIRQAVSSRIPWISDSSERKEAAKDAISQGDECKMLVMEKQLSDHHRNVLRAGKKFTTSDMKSLRALRRHLADELSVVYDITPSEVRPYVKKKASLSHVIH